jgi:hypothetical protein
MFFKKRKLPDKKTLPEELRTVGGGEVKRATNKQRLCRKQKQSGGAGGEYLPLPENTGGVYFVTVGGGGGGTNSRGPK